MLLDGIEVTPRIRAGEAPGAHIPVVAMKAHAMTGDRERCIDVGMEDYICKPTSRDALRRALARHAPRIMQS